MPRVLAGLLVLLACGPSPSDTSASTGDPNTSTPASTSGTTTATTTATTTVTSSTDPSAPPTTTGDGTTGTTATPLTSTTTAEVTTTATTTATTGPGDACPHEDACLVRCAEAVPDPFPRPAGCTADALAATCLARCCDVTAELADACAGCVIDTLEVAIADDTCDVVAGIFAFCATHACDTLYPCQDACGDDSACLRPCIADAGPTGVCAFPGSGTCSCGGVIDDDCIAPATCFCPSCGEGEGICLTPAQQASVCFDYQVDPLDAANDHFACP